VKRFNDFFLYVAVVVFSVSCGTAQLTSENSKIKPTKIDPPLNDERVVPVDSGIAAKPNNVLKIISEPEEHYREHFEYGDGSDGYMSRIVTDFNNDGLEDIAFAYSGYCGNDGCPWTIYIQTNKNRYSQKDFSFSEDAIYIDSSKPGFSLVSTYNRIDLDNGEIMFYKIEGDKIELFSKKKAIEDSEDYGRLFEDKTFKTAQCTSNDFKRSACSW
jgi:hypothetical protein